MTERIDIPESQKRQGWKRKLWGYTYVVASGGTQIEVDAFPGTTVILPVLYFGYGLYELGWKDMLLYGVLAPVVLVAAFAVGLGVFLRFRTSKEVKIAKGVLCAYCERRITAATGRVRSRHTGEVFCLRTDCESVGKKLRKKRQESRGT